MPPAYSACVAKITVSVLVRNASLVISSLNGWIMSLVLHLHLSRSLVDRWGTIDDLATSFLHSYRLSAFLMAAPSVMPVHSGTLSSQLFSCLPLILLPCTLPCRISLVNNLKLMKYYMYVCYRHWVSPYPSHSYRRTTIIIIKTTFSKILLLKSLIVNE